MTDPISPLPTLDSAVQEFINVWAANLGQVLAQISGTAFAVESSLTPPPEFPVPQEHDLQMSVVVAGSLRGEMNLRVPRPAMLGLGQLFLQEPQNASAELKPDHRDALEELLRQAAGQIATGLSSRWAKLSSACKLELRQAGLRALAAGFSPGREFPTGCLWSGS